MSVLKRYGVVLLYCMCTISSFALDAEIDRAKHFLSARAVQNWQNGTIDAEMQLLLKEAGLKLPADRQEAFTLIEHYAPYLLKDIYLSVTVDSARLLGNYLAEGFISFDDISAALAKSTESDARMSRNLEKALIYESGTLHELSKLFIKHNNPYTPAVPPIQGSSQKYSGIIIDARGILPIHGEYLSEKLQPALFPKIWDSDMNLIYEKNMVLPETALDRCIVQYSSSLDEKDYTDIIGKNPLRIVARGIFGVNRCDILIAKTDAAKILSKQNLNLIQNARVLIICDNLLKEPKYPQPDENFYFAYRDIETVIGEDDTGVTVEQKPDDSVIKITMYNIHFVADQAIILPTDYGRIDIIAEALRRLGNNVRFVIEGHTAELHRPHDQQILSEQRAQEMAKELIKRGLDANRIKTAGFGATVPIAPSDNEENKAKNRRVEIKIIRK